MGIHISPKGCLLIIKIQYRKNHPSHRCIVKSTMVNSIPTNSHRQSHSRLDAHSRLPVQSQLPVRNPGYPCTIPPTRAQSRLPMRNPGYLCTIPATRAQSWLSCAIPATPAQSRLPARGYPRNHRRQPKGCQVMMGSWTLAQSDRYLRNPDF